MTSPVEGGGSIASTPPRGLSQSPVGSDPASPRRPIRELIHKLDLANAPWEEVVEPVRKDLEGLLMSLVRPSDLPAPAR